MQIRTDFDSANIQLESLAHPQDIRLTIRKDPGPEGFFQWFHFRLTGAKGQPVALRIVNAGEATYARGWDGYRAVKSADRKTWTRVDTSYADGVLEIRDTPESDSVFYAYFAPYSAERRHDFVSQVLATGKARLEELGDTLDGEAMQCLVFGPDKPERTLWIIARQHPGESMASWWMEGFLSRLIRPGEALARTVLQTTRLMVVPNMCPDGSRRGHLRTNAAGANLNREWATPTLEKSPEVLLVRNRMEETGVDGFLDVHGDEALPYVFIAGTDGIPSWSDRLAGLRRGFDARLMAACPDYQTEHGYPKNAPGKANLSMASNWVGERFGCLAMTLEMPFKDNANLPDAVAGWSPERSALLGWACLDAWAAVLPDLR